MTKLRGDYRLFIDSPVNGERLDVTDETTSPIYTFGFVKPHAYRVKDRIMHDIETLSNEHGTPLYLWFGKDDMLSKQTAEEHYKVHRERPFFRDLVRMVTEGPIHKFILTGYNAISTFRSLLGATNPARAAKRTIRHKYGEPEKGIAYNAVHGSDSIESFVEEVILHFTREDMDDTFWSRIDAYREWLEHFKGV